MLRAKDFRRQAWEKKTGKWGLLAAITLIYSLIFGACGGLCVFYVGEILLLIVSGPLTLGYTVIGLNVMRSKEVTVEKLFCGFKQFTRSFVLYITNALLIAAWTLLLVIPGIIKTFSYAMSYQILHDNPEMSANEARKKSMELMKGNKWRLFCLQFSFIGWVLLSILTLGILTFWVMPYQQAAVSAFYISLLPEQPAQTESAEEQSAEPYEQPAESSQE